MDHRPVDPSDRYDVVFVGSGMGSMTAAALLAKSGQKVLVVEALGAPGGYAHAFRRGPYTFDPAIHSIVDPSIFQGLLAYLDVADECTFLPLDRLYKATMPAVSVDAPLTTEQAFLAEYTRTFPDSAAALESFFALCKQIHRDAHQLPARIALADLESVSARFPEVFRYRKATVATVLDEFFDDAQVKVAASAMGLLLGLPPSQLSFQTFCQMLYGYLDNGAFYVQGGVEGIIDALAIALERHGGDLLLGSGVDKILVADGRCTGVRLADGRTVAADTVVSNADALQTFLKLVGTEHLPEPFVRNLRRLKPSGSGFSLYAASKCDLEALGASHLMFSWMTGDAEADYKASSQGEPGCIVLFIPTMVDHTLAPVGEHLVTATIFVPYEVDGSWAAHKTDYMELLLEQTDRVLPGFRAGLQLSDCASPLTLERFSMNYHGAIYGWENTPETTASKRPGHHTPIAGLYLAGQWTQPGAGFLRATVSGMHTAELIMIDKAIAADSRFRHPHLPPLG